MNSRNLLILIIIILGVAAYFLFRPQTFQSNQIINVTPTEQPASNTALTPQVKTFDVEGTPFQFNPKEIRAKKGDTVRINFINKQGFHDLVVEGLNVGTKQIQAGQQDSIEFVAEKAGTFAYYCSVNGHRQQGMEGKLIIEE